MELKRLRYFVVVAEELSFTRAAARLRISQPPLSQMIARMEEEIGFQLFERTKRRVALTEGGKVFLEDARKILTQADQAVRRARTTAHGEIGHLRVGFTTWVDSTDAFLEIFRRFGATAPGVTVDFYSTASWAAAEALDDGRVDVAFVTERPHSSTGSDCVLVVEEDLIAALPARHKLAARATVPLRELAREPQIIVAPDRIVPRYSPIRLVFSQNDVEFTTRHMIDHPQTTLALVAAGTGVALVPASMQNVGRPGVVFRPVTPTGRLRIFAAWKTANRAAALEAFVQTIRDVVAHAKPGHAKPRKKASRRPAAGKRSRA